MTRFIMFTHLVVMMLLGANAQEPSQVYRVPPSGSSNMGWYKHAGVAADSQICANIAKTILQRNGSVVDAGIAAQLCNGVVDQAHMGLGGGSINLVYASPREGGEKELVYLSGDSRAPNWVTNMSAFGIDYIPSPYHLVLNDDGTPIEWDKHKGLTVGVPGEVITYYNLWQKFGKLPWKEVVQPSITLAKDGFELTPGLVNTIYEFNHLIRTTPSLANVFTKKSKALYSRGNTLTDPVLGETLEIIAEDPMSFYNGKLAEDIISDVREFGGKLTKEDLMSYRPRTVEALQFPVKNGEYTATIPGQPFAGHLFVLAYNVMKGYNMTVSDVSTPEGLTLFYHRFLETWKFTLSHTNCIGDSWQEKTTCKEFIPKMTSTTYADIIRSLIEDSSVQSSTDNYLMMERDPQVDMTGTSHLSVVGEDGSVFLSTSTINSEFGLEGKGKRTGIIFNNRLIDFSRETSLNGEGPADDANALGPNKEAMSFRIPILVMDKNGHPVLAIGASGGSRIITALMQDMWMHLEFGLTLKDAIDFPRMVMFPIFPYYNTYYDEFDQKIKDGILQKNHPSFQSVYPMFLYTGVTQGVSLRDCEICRQEQCENPCIEAVSDYRKAGGPDGY